MVSTVSKYPVQVTQKPRKRDFWQLKSKNFPGEACLSTPLEACAFGACLGNRSVFILDQRLNISLRVGQLKSSPLF